MSFKQLLALVQGYLPPEKIAIVEEAYTFAFNAHQGQKRRSGEPYIEHPLQTAMTLAELQMDTATIEAALLHDVTENCDIPISEIEARFGAEVSKLVDGTTRLGKISLSGEGSREVQAESLRKMLVAMAEDLRVVFIKLADRLHNMRTLEALLPEKQVSIAQETLEIYAPLAHRLGIWELKWQLEDLAFRYLEPRRYRQIANRLASRRTQREGFITRVMEILNSEFEKAGLRAEVSGRPKHIYSIHQKMENYAAVGKEFDDIYDLLALRVIVSTISDCYRVLGIVHGLWHPLPDEFDDFIANRKPNGYQSLHTAVMCLGNEPLEVQIRTREMHYVAEYGVAAHWRYKEGEKKDLHFEDRIGWLRQLVDWHRELGGTEEFLESVKTDIFIDQVFVFTPKGEIKDLPKGSTPLDFAYRVHTELGHRCVGTKINGRLVPLNSQLNNGDVVEIMTTKGDKGPSRDWLNPNLGYIKTSGARQKIRQWFNQQERAENITQGRELLEKELQHLGLRQIEREKLARLFGHDNLEDFLAAIGDGSIATNQIALKLSAQQAQQPKLETKAVSKPPDSAVRVLGVGDLLTRLAQCCHPVFGDKIIGYTTRNRGISIHRQDCYNILHEDEQERLITVEWGQADGLYPVNVHVRAWDRVGLVRDITTVVANEKINITSVNFVEHDDHSASTFLTLETKDLAQLSRLMGKIEGVRGVINVTRVGDDVFKARISPN